MKRVIFIGKRNYRNKICILMLTAFVFYVIFFSLRLITFEDIWKIANGSVKDWIYNITVSKTRDSYRTIAYREHINNKKTVAGVLIDRINSSISYYGYVKENVKEEKLVVYDPNKLYLNQTLAENTTEQKETEGITENINETTEALPNEVTVSVTGNGIMKLTGAGGGTVYSLESLNDFNYLMNTLYVVPQRASVLSSELIASELLNIDLSIQKDSTVPQILIYHTHSMEGFTDSIEGNKDTNIVAVGTYLSQLLSEGYGYNVIHCMESFDYVDGVLDRSKAYTYARTSLEQILADNPTIQVVLDIHRDGVGETTHLVTEVNGKQTSQIMFFNGVSRTKAGGDIDYLYNKYKKQNLAMSLQMKLLAEEYFPGFTRRNYIDAYQYNLDLRERSMLIEVGAQTNNLSEAKNAMEPLAALLDRLLSGDDGGI